MSDTQHNDRQQQRQQQQPSIDQIQLCNWEGCIPTVVSLAPTSLSTPTGPPPIHILLSRQTFLHLGLAAAVRRLHPFAPPSFGNRKVVVREEPEPGDVNDDDEEDPSESSTTGKRGQQRRQQQNDDFPVCWWEDEETNLPLRWHLWAGVLYDLQGRKPSSLPWRLRLHFTNYPTGTILPLSVGEVERQIRAVYQNSLKQAVTLRTNQARSSLQLLTKESHETLWQAIHNNQAATTPTPNAGRLYRQVANDLQPKLQNVASDQARIPVRVFWRNQTKNVMASQPPIQRSCLVREKHTLRTLFQAWLPDLLLEKRTVAAAAAAASWKVNGIQPPLDVSLLELWEHLCHADLFLYIVVLSPSD